MEIYNIENYIENKPTFHFTDEDDFTEYELYVYGDNDFDLIIRQDNQSVALDNVSLKTLKQIMNILRKAELQ
jgi:hypothetical protein